MVGSILERNDGPPKYMYSMHMSFEFDPAKAQLNWQKHRVRFEDMEPVFDDPYALTRPDEPRWLTVGCDALGRIVTVCYTQREPKIRLISARLTTKQERTHYEN